jgi:hypothetical protein
VAAALGSAGQLLASLDACHAGSGLRSLDGRERGERQVFGPPQSTTGNTPDKTYTLPNLPANIIAFYAASPAESNRECRIGETDYGSLSYALSKAFEDTNPYETCLDLFDRVRQQMASRVPDQHPQMQGNSNLLLFSGKTVTTPRYIPLRQVVDAKLVWVEGGNLAGLGIGSQLAFYPIGVTDTLGKQPLAIGSVIKVEPTASKIKLDLATNSDALRQSRAYLRYQNFGPFNLRVRCNLPEGAFKKELLECMRIYPNLLLNKDTFDVEIVKDTLRNAAGYVLANGNSQAPDFWVKKMVAYMRGQWLRKIDFQDENMRCEFELIALKNGLPRTPIDTISIFNRRDEAGVTIVREGETLVVKVRNKGTKPAYFTLLDFQPDGIINMVLDNFEPVLLESGEIWWSDTNGRYRPGPVAPPYGTEMIRLYATEYPVDFRPLVNATRSPSYQTRNDLERLFDGTRSTNRSPQTNSIKTGGVSTFSRVFQIVQKQ